MNNWNIEKIGKFATIGRGSSPRPITDKRYFENGTIPWIKIADATAAGRVIYKTKEYVNEYGASFSRLLKKGSLILSASGVSLGIPRFLGVDGCIHDGWLYLEDIHGIDVNFLYYKLLTLRQYFDNLSYGAAIQNINTDIFSNTKIQLPPLPTQQKIASILSTYDNLIQNYKKQIEDLQTTASELYKEWFVRFRFPGYKTTQFENGIPVGWKVEKLEDFGITLESGSRPSGGVDTSLEEGIPSLGAECINGLAEFDYSNVKYIPADYYEKMKRGKNKGNHILVYKDGAYIGKVTLFRNKFPFEKYAINEHVFFLNTNNSNYLNWLYFTLKQESYFNLMQNLNRNAAQPGLSQPDIGRIKIRIPSEDAVIKFNEFVEPIFNTVFDLARANQNLAKQRDLLLPRLMSGKLEVE